MTNIFYDTEFIDDGKTIDLISIGMVADDGRELYLESMEFDNAKATSNPWLVENVLANLKGGGWATSRALIARQVKNFIGSSYAPNLWAWFAAYDHVAYAQLFGAMIGLPPGLPQQTDDLVTLMKLAGIPRDALPKQEGTEHNALDDARWNKQVFDFIVSHSV